jgi:hypothetical protein
MHRTLMTGVTFDDNAERAKKLAKLLVRDNKAAAKTTSIMQHLA